MGTLSHKYAVEGRTVADFGLAFADLKKENIEKFYVVQVGADGTMFDPYLVAYGQQDKVRVSMVQMTRYIAEYIDHGFVMLHNHPNGSGPSKADWEITKSFIALSKASKKICYDHCVVSGIDYYLRTLAPEIF